MSDDLRMHSGVATVSKDIVIGTLNHYEWVQIGGAINHPDEGKIIDMSQHIQNDYGIKDASLKIFPIRILALVTACLVIFVAMRMGIRFL